jgi:hypothetical protein
MRRDDSTAIVTCDARPTDLAVTLRRAVAAHGEHERRTGGDDADWPDWYAEYVVREQTGQKLPD